MKKIILTMAILIGFTSVADAGKFTSGSDTGTKKDFERILQEIDKLATNCHNTVIAKDEYDDIKLNSAEMIDGCAPLYWKATEAFSFLLDTNNADVLADCSNTTKASTCSIMVTQVFLKLYVYFFSLEQLKLNLADVDLSTMTVEHYEKLDAILQSPLGLWIAGMRGRLL